MSLVSVWGTGSCGVGGSGIGSDLAGVSSFWKWFDKHTVSWKPVWLYCEVTPWEQSFHISVKSI